MLAGSGTLATVEAETLAVVWPLPAPKVNVKFNTSVSENGVPPGTTLIDVAGLNTSELVPTVVRLALALSMGVEPPAGCPNKVFDVSRNPW